jgi:hypothetical protein
VRDFAVRDLTTVLPVGVDDEELVGLTEATAAAGERRCRDQER